MDVLRRPSIDADPHRPIALDPPDPIEMTLIGDRALVFLPSAASELRERHRILGRLVGCLPAYPRQNIQLGTPLELSQEETTLLLEKGLARFKRTDQYPGHCSESEVASYESFLAASRETQMAASTKSREREIDANADRIVAGALRNRREDQGETGKKKRRKMEEVQPSPPPSAQVPDLILADVKSRIRPLPENCVILQTFDVQPFDKEDLSGSPCLCDKEKTSSEMRIGTCSDPSDALKKDPPSTMDEIEIKKNNYDDEKLKDRDKGTLFTESPLGASSRRFVDVVWSFPSTPLDRLRYATFKHFWDAGYCVTGGAKFGGDFLAYPGDPLRYHSFFIAVCLSFDESLSAQNLISFARLGNSVKKTVVLCSLDDDERLVKTSIEWSQSN